VGVFVVAFFPQVLGMSVHGIIVIRYFIPLSFSTRRVVSGAHVVKSPLRLSSDDSGTCEVAHEVDVTLVARVVGAETIAHSLVWREPPAMRSRMLSEDRPAE
jgi:hypothetical protein